MDTIICIITCIFVLSVIVIVICNKRKKYKKQHLKKALIIAFSSYMFTILTIFIFSIISFFSNPKGIFNSIDRILNEKKYNPKPIEISSFNKGKVTIMGDYYLIKGTDLIVKEKYILDSGTYYYFYKDYNYLCRTSLNVQIHKNGNKYEIYENGVLIEDCRY